MSDYTPYQQDVLTSLGTIGACVQLALIFGAVFAMIATVKNLW